MTESQAWVEVARRFAEGERDGSKGLCAMVGLLFHDDLIEQRIDTKMKVRVYAHMDRMEAEPILFAWPCERAFDELRILAALFLSLEAADEAQAQRSEKAA